MWRRTLRKRTTVAVAAAAASFAVAATAQNTQDVPVFRTSTAAVTVDVLVRDRNGQPVPGLTQEDFEVFEDGVPQRIIGFTATGRAPLAADETSEVGLPRVGAPLPDAQSVVAIVFHQLPHQSRASAVKAARPMIASLAPGEYAAIFLLDLRLTALTPLTRNTRVLRAALDRVLRTPPVIVEAATGSGVAETAGPPGRFLTTESMQAAEIRQRLKTGADGQHAAAQAASLNDIVALLARFPGRKAVILFSEGLAVSPRLETVVDRARGENVSVYTINPRGLDPGGSLSLTGRDIDRNDLSGTSRADRQSHEHRFESDRTFGLGPLALYTGGFLVADTNDILRGLADVNADRRAFYVLAYASSNAALDNTVRHIEVRVKRPAVSVRARSAYVAAKPQTR